MISQLLSPALVRSAKRLRIFDADTNGGGGIEDANMPHDKSRKGQPRFKHGLSGHPLYRRCSSAIARCENPEHRAYANYGGRGIRVHAAWLDVAVFVRAVEDEIGIPSQQVDIDRIDNDRGYEPGNIRWSSRKENCRNQRRTRLITARGEQLPIGEWAERLGASAAVIAERLKAGWTVDRAVTVPVGGERDVACGSARYNARFTESQVLDLRSAHAGGESQRAIARRLGVNVQTINFIVRRRTWKHI